MVRKNRWLQLLLYNINRFKSNIQCKTIKKDLPTDISFAVLVPCYKSEFRFLRATILSVIKQTYPNWRLYLGLSSVEPQNVSLLKNMASSESRIKIIELPPETGISDNTNRIAKEATADYIAFLDHDDCLQPDALAAIAAKISENPSADIIYSDEDRFMEDFFLFHSRPSIKPDWAPQSFLSFNYICHFLCIRRSLFNLVDGLRKEFDGAQDYDLILRASEKTTNIFHIGRVLYSWRIHSASTAQGHTRSKPYAHEAAKKALRAMLNRRRVEGIVEDGKYLGTYRVRRKISCNLKVGVIIPIIASDIKNSRYLVNNMQELLSYHSTLVSSTISPCFIDSYTKFANSIYKYIQSIDSDIIIFLSPQIISIEQNWLDAMVEILIDDNVGVVGGLISDKKRKIVHSGFIVDYNRCRFDFHEGMPLYSGGYSQRLCTIQNVTAVSALFMATWRKLFLDVGGFEPSFPKVMYDVDYCLKIIKLQKMVVFTPYALATVERNSPFLASRVSQKEINHEKEMLIKKWGDFIKYDRFFNPSAVLSLI